MWKLFRRLIYQRWFSGFLAAILWFDCWSDIVDLVEVFSTHEFLSVIFSSAAAILVTLIFLDLYARSPRERR